MADPPINKLIPPGGGLNQALSLVFLVVTKRKERHESQKIIEGGHKNVRQKQGQKSQTRKAKERQGQTNQKNSGQPLP